jgi:hypothetical protein
MQYQWDGKLIAQTPVYSAEAYQTAMLIFPAAFVLALFMTILLSFQRKNRSLATLSSTPPQAL